MGSGEGRWRDVLARLYTKKQCVGAMYKDAGTPRYQSRSGTSQGGARYVRCGQVEGMCRGVAAGLIPPARKRNFKAEETRRRQRQRQRRGPEGASGTSRTGGGGRAVVRYWPAGGGERAARSSRCEMAGMDVSKSEEGRNEESDERACARVGLPGDTHDSSSGMPQHTDRSRVASERKAAQVE